MNTDNKAQTQPNSPAEKSSPKKTINQSAPDDSDKQIVTDADRDPKPDKVILG